jgi:single-stranded-DNA-specific exonuclease
MYLENNQYLLDNKSLVLSNKNWHKGILGIVASRLVEKYYRPVLLISIQNDIGIASGRSIPGFNLYEGIYSCKEYIVDFGGHAMAAGFKINKEKIELFKKKFEETVFEKTDLKTFEPEILIDYQLSFDDITDRFLSELELLQPFGTEMEAPIFSAKNVSVCFSKTVGKNHRYMILNQPESKMKTKINAIKFNANTDDFKKSFFDEIVFKLSYNYYNNKKSKQIIVEEM